MAVEGSRQAFDAVSAPLKLRRRLLGTIITFARRQPLGAIGAGILLFVVIMAILAPVVAPHDPLKTNVLNKYEPPGATVKGKTYLLGTDQLGRDTLSNLMYGARISILVGLIGVGIGVTLGALIGLVSGYIGGKLDLLVQRIVDAFMAFPVLIFALGLMAVLGPSLKNVIFVLVIIFIPGASRLVRSEAISVKERDYVDAARSIGSSDTRILFRHVLPQCVAPYIVFATANLGYAIVVEASLSFLGVGTPIDIPSWGGMLAISGQKYIELSPWLLVFPSLAISLVVFGFNLFGDAMRDILDPRLRGT